MTYLCFGNRLPSTDALNGSSFTSTEASSPWAMRFTGGRVRWSFSDLAGDDEYDAVEVRTDTFLVLIWMTSTGPGSALTVLVDKNIGTFLLCHSTFGDGSTPPRVAQTFSRGLLTGAPPASVRALPQPTRTLEGQTLVTKYDADNVFEHSYLPDSMAWRCRQGDLPGSTGLDPASFFQVGPQQFIVGFREQQFDSSSVVFMDLEQ